jgi:hypothetical protein
MEDANLKKKNQFVGYDTFEDDPEELTLSEEVELIDKENRNRRLKKLLTKIFLIFLTLCLSLSVFSVISFCWADIGLQKDVTKTCEPCDDLFYTNGTIKEDNLMRMQEFIENMPKTFRDAIKDDWAIVLLDKAPDKLFHTSLITINDYDTSGMVIGGYTFTQPRTIYVNRTLDEETMYRAFVHEVGHFVSFELSSIHGSSEWEALYEKYLNNFDTEAYNLSNEAEFFAACFDLYYNEADKLKTEAPDVYDYMDSVLKQEVKDDNIFEMFFAGCTNSINTLRVYYYYYIVKR